MSTSLRTPAVLRHSLAALAAILAFWSIAPTASAYKFVDSCGPTWSAQPLPWYIHQAGYSQMPFETVRTIFQNSFSVWSQPCCSDFRSTYAGTTELTATNRQGRLSLSFEERSWPSQMGSVDQTIAVTLLSFYNNCTIATAPILFNGVGFTFTANGRSGTDLQAVATHEIGHLLGLDHSNSSSATMYYAYTGGTSARVLDPDDIAGVCALYPKACSCTQDSQCQPGQACIGGQCKQAPCTSNSQCAQGLACVNGDCVQPSCATSDQCAPGFSCENNRCVSGCPVCRSCTTQADCGANGFCADLGGGNNKCLVVCGRTGECPGDSTCYQVPVDNETYYLCLNPGAENGAICPENYTCDASATASQPPTQGCPGLGTFCNENGTSCNPANDVCLVGEDNTAFCSCMCQQDADCGSGNACVDLTNDQKACVPASMVPPSDPCQGVTCPSDQVCSNGQCIATGGGTGGSTGTGGNTGTGGTNGGTTGGTNNATDDGVVFFADNEPKDKTCSTTGSGNLPDASLAALAAIALVRLARRRRA